MRKVKNTLIGILSLIIVSFMIIPLMISGIGYIINKIAAGFVWVINGGVIWCEWLAMKNN